MGHVGEAVCTVEVSVGCVGEGPVGAQRQRAIRGASHQDHSQCVPVWVGVVAQDARRWGIERRVLNGGIGVVHRHRSVVDCRDGDGHRGHVGVGRPIVHLVGEAVCSQEARVWRVGEGTVTVQRHGTVAGCRNQDGGKRVAVPVGVVARNTRGGNNQNRVLVGGVDIVHGHRDILNRVDRDRNRSDVRVGDTVVRFVSKAVCSVEVRVRRVGERTVAIEHHRTIRGASDQDCRQRVTVWVAVVGQNAKGRNGQGDVLVGHVGVVVREGKVVHRRDCDDHGSYVGVRRAVIHLVGKAVRTVEVAVRSVVEGAIGDEVEETVGGPAYQSSRQGVSVHIKVIDHDPWHRHNKGKVVLVDCVCVIYRNRHILYRVHRDGNCGYIGSQRIVVSLVGE